MLRKGVRWVHGRKSTSIYILIPSSRSMSVAVFTLQFSFQTTAPIFLQKVCLPRLPPSPTPHGQGQNLSSGCFLFSLWKLTWPPQPHSPALLLSKAMHTGECVRVAWAPWLHSAGILTSLASSLKGSSLPSSLKLCHSEMLTLTTCSLALLS